MDTESDDIVCTVCKELKAQTEFYSGNKHCKACKKRIDSERLKDPLVRKKNREIQIMRHYNLPPEKHKKMISSQKNSCAICGGKGKKREKATLYCKVGTIPALSIDHCHETGNVRALLCHQCNSGLGHFGDSVPVLVRALIYLIKHNRYSYSILTWVRVILRRR
jgi:hypothetical protein